MPSIREEISSNLVDTCVFGSLNDSYGVLTGKYTDKKGKSYRAVTFCRAAILDGEIRIYNHNYIVITWQTAIRDLPSKGRQVCRSEDEAKSFMMRFIPR